MKNLFYNCFLGMSVILFFGSCTEKTIVTYYETGQKHEEYQYYGDSLKQGHYTKYSDQGVLIETANYVKNKLEGQRIIYNFKNGIKEISESYSDDTLHGQYLMFHPNGETRYIGQYTKNILSGTVNIYDTLGVLTKELQYVNNYEVIPFQEFHENGKVKWEGTKRYDPYFQTKKDYGLLLEYNENGDLIRKMDCDEKEICTTIWTIDRSHK